MALVIYIPVLFVCLNNHCSWMQGVYYTSQSDCKAVLVEQKAQVEDMAAKAKQKIILLQSTCITAKEGML